MNHWSKVPTLNKAQIQQPVICYQVVCYCESLEFNVPQETWGTSVNYIPELTHLSWGSWSMCASNPLSYWVKTVPGCGRPFVLGWQNRLKQKQQKILVKEIHVQVVGSQVCVCWTSKCKGMWIGHWQTLVQLCYLSSGLRP